MGINIDEAVLDVEKFDNTTSCLNCGNPISEGLKRYCSKKCSGRYMDKECEHCGRQYYATETKQRFCSKECSYKGKASIGRPPKPIPIANCEFCGNEFSKRSNNQRYCSRKCGRTNRGNPSKTKTCRYCQIQFRSNRQFYCSEECAREYKNKQRKDSDNITRQSFYRRDKFRCVYCGSSPIEDGVKLAVDHIIPISKGGSSSIDNLVTCCKKCNSAKCNESFNAEVIQRIQAVVQDRNQSLSNSDRATLEQFAKRMNKPNRRMEPQ